MGLDSSSGQLTSLTVDFHEPGFVGMLNGETTFRQEKGFWFQLSDQDKEKAKSPWGPANPQALNRYSYVLNNPLRYVDPSGHLGVTFTPISVTYHLTHDEATQAFNAIEQIGPTLISALLSAASSRQALKIIDDWGTAHGPGGILVAAIVRELLPYVGDVAAVVAALTAAAAVFAFQDWLYGGKGIDLYMGPLGPLLILPPTVEEQHGVWIGDGINKGNDKRVPLDTIGRAGNLLLDLLSR